MKKKIWTLFRVIVLVGAIAYLIPFNTDTVKAEGCPPGEAVGAGCMFLYGEGVTIDNETEWTCTYLCVFGSGSTDPFTIEKTITFVE